MSNIIETLGFKKRTHVGISLSANNFIELVCVDNKTRSVVKYASSNIKYNTAIREIIDFDEFKEVIENLFEDVGLNPKECSVTLNLPNVHFGITSLESTAETPFIIENLQTDIEDLYIFKRNEPIISYSILDSTTNSNQKNIVYSAIQTKMIVKIIEIFDNLEIDIVRIDNSYAALLKAIQYCDKFKKFLEKEEKTSILLITPNSCCSFYLNANILVDSFEEPLAIKSFSSEEVYSTIFKIASNAIQKNKPKSLLIISETDEVNSEIISQKLEFDGEIEFVNKSLDSNDQFIEISGIDDDVDANMVSFMTLEAVGAAVADFEEYPLNINFVPQERINANLVEVQGYEVDFFRFAMITLGTSAILAIILGVCIVALCNVGANSTENTTSDATRQIEVFSKKTETYNKEQEKNIFPTLTKILENNKSLVNVYNALSTEIPDYVYIRKFVSNTEGGIGILGEARSSESVDIFVKGLREKNDNLMLSKLSINSKDDFVQPKITNGFTFEIKTSNVNVSFNEEEDIIKSNIQNTLSNAANANKRQQNNNRKNSLTPPPAPVI